MESLKAKRKGFRTSFTVCAKKVDDALSKAVLDLEQLSKLGIELTDKFEKLNECQEEVSDNLQSEEDKKNYEVDLEKAEDYRKKYCSLNDQIDSKLKESAVEKDVAEKRKFKLPQIELKKFSGEAKEFSSFWSQFEKIYLDDNLPPEHKLQYLLKAARVIESFPDTASNYAKAVEQLKERFVQFSVRELLSMVKKNAITRLSKADLPVLYNELKGKLRALESLGRTQEKYGDFLTPLVESCLPEDVLIAWERSSRDALSDDHTLQKLMLFLEGEVISMELRVENLNI